jgi:2,5-diketo-D-gluconate reductase A
MTVSVAVTDEPGWDPAVELGDGVRMPLVGCGTQYGFAEDGNERGAHERGTDYVAMALRAGFRLLDTARGYGTEPHVAAGIAAAGVPRQRVFVVTKAWPGNDHAAGRDGAAAAIEASAAGLGGYVDLFLVHQPVAGWQDLWRALEDAKDRGLVRAIGVSNFGIAELEQLRTFARHRPVANQLHLHPFVYPHHAATVRHCAQHGIRVLAFPRAPWRLGAGSAIDAVAARHGCTRAQVMLRWAVERGCAVVPLSTNARHLAENFAVRELRLTAEEVAAIDAVGEPGGLQHHVDLLDRRAVAGWAFARGGITRIRVVVDGGTVGEAVHGLPRDDVGAAHPQASGASRSGFGFVFPATCWAEGPGAVQLEFELGNGDRIATAPRIA